MELIYTDPNGKELGYILNANIDMEIGEDEKNSINDFEIENQSNCSHKQTKSNEAKKKHTTLYNKIKASKIKRN